MVDVCARAVGRNARNVRSDARHVRFAAPCHVPGTLPQPRGHDGWAAGSTSSQAKRFEAHALTAAATEAFAAPERGSTRPMMRVGSAERWMLGPAHAAGVDAMPPLSTCAKPATRVVSNAPGAAPGEDRGGM